MTDRVGLEHINETCKKIATDVYDMRRVKWINDERIDRTVSVLCLAQNPH